MEIIFPKLSTIAYADNIIKNCASAQERKGSLIFNLEKTTWMDPFAVTVLAGTIKCCLPNPTIQYHPPKNDKLNKYLSQIGFKRLFHINGEDIHRESSVELAQLTNLEPLYIESLITLIDSKMRLSQGMKDSLKLSINEVLTNVFDHSNSREGCFVCAQYYPAKKTIRLCITDFGVGILSNLKEKYRLSSDIDAIKRSVEEGVTSRPQSAGFGLAHIRRFLKVNEGTLTMISGRGKVNFYSDKIESYNMSRGLDGTSINMKINANKESLYRLSGEEEAFF